MTKDPMPEKREYDIQWIEDGPLEPYWRVSILNEWNKHREPALHLISSDWVEAELAKKDDHISVLEGQKETLEKNLEYTEFKLEEAIEKFSAIRKESKSK